MNRWRRENGSEPAEAPLVVAEKVKGAMRLSAVSPEARSLGLEIGLTLADARARAPSLTVAEHDGVADAALLGLIADDCERFSPVVVLDAPDGVLIEITGCDHLFGGERELGKAFCERVRRFGVDVRASIATAPDAARALARYSRIAIVPPGRDEMAVRPLPIAALGVTEDVRIALSRAGLKIIADLADRPSTPLVARFGSDITLRLARTTGRADTPLDPRRAPPVFVAARRFPEPIGRAEDIEGALRELAEEISVQLGETRQGGRIFEASFFRADGAVRRIAVETGRPARDPPMLLRLFRERLDALADPIDPGFGFDLVRLSVTDAQPLATMQSSLDGRVRDGEAIADLIGRLATRFGRDRVLRIEPQDTHMPEREAMLVPALDEAGETPSWLAAETGEPPTRPLHLFDPPQPVTAMAEVPDGPPVQFTWRKARHVVARAEGPERIAPEWWRRHEPTRDYFRIEDEEGRRFWLFRSGLYERETTEPRWFIHGVSP